MKLLSVFLSLLFPLAWCCGNHATVSTDLGQIRGSVLQTRLGENFYAFRGIRYANAPVGDLRFKNPEPVTSWKPEVFDATTDGPMCPQPTTNMSDASEDCLRLNVYSKDLRDGVKKPVLFYIHPGGFYFVSGQSKNFAGPELLMDRDIVLVTINYRLGSLGYLATGTKEAPGNAGFKDQVAAMRWVRDNISKFGGDPNSVTLVGYSAGGVSIVLHTVSPMSKNLFHRAIAMSGSGTTQWRYKPDQMGLAQRQAGLVNCPKDDVNEMVQCLRKADMTALANSLSGMFEFARGHPILLWEPVLEKDFGQERFLTENPVKAIQEGRFQRVPIIVGITKDEFLSSAVWVLKNQTTTQELNDNFEKLAPICLLYERDSERSRNITKTLKREYLKNQPLSLETSIEPLGKLFSDGVISFAVHRFMKLASQYTPVYYYKFEYKGRYSHLYYPDKEVYGAVHHDDLLYLLSIPVLAPIFKKTDPENDTIERMTRMWTQFAKSGNPNNEKDSYLRGVNWQPCTNDITRHLVIGQNDLKMVEGDIFPQRFALWDELFPL